MPAFQQMTAAQYRQEVGGVDGGKSILKPIPLNGLKLGPEDRLSVEVMNMMRAAKVSGRYVGVFSHVANESGAPGSKQTILRSVKKKAMGMVPGTPDWWFLWPSGAGVIELKRHGVKEGGLSDSQKEFRDWCREDGVRWAICNKLEDVEATLIKWGAMGRAA